VQFGAGQRRGTTKPACPETRPK